MGIRLDGIMNLPRRVTLQLLTDDVERPVQQRQVIKVKRSLPPKETVDRERAFKHYSNKLWLNAFNALSLSSSLTRKEML